MHQRLYDLDLQLRDIRSLPLDGKSEERILGGTAAELLNLSETSESEGR